MGGISEAGGNAAAAASNPGAGPASIGGFSTSASSFDVDTKGLDQLSSKLKMVTSDISSLESQVSKLAATLDKAAASGSKFSGSMPGTGGGTGGSRNTAAPVSGGPQSGGSNGMNRAVAGGVAGEIGAQFAGQINTGMNNIKQGGMAIDLQTRQAGATFGGNQNFGMGGVQTSGYTNQLNMSQADLSKGIAAQQANAFLYAPPNSNKQAQLNKNINALQKLNPGMSNAGASQFLSTLASGPALSAMQRYGVNNGLIRSGADKKNPDGINGPQQMLSSLVKTFFGGQNLSAKQMKASSGTSAGATQDWVKIAANYGTGGSMGTNFSAQELNTVRQFMAAGGNLNQAESKMKGSVAGTALSRSTATTKTKQDTFETTADVQNWSNDFMTAVQKMSDLEVKAHPILLSMVAGFTGLGAAALKLTATFLEANAMMKGLGGLPGGGGKGVLGKVKKIFTRGGGAGEAGEVAAGGAGAGEVAAGGGAVGAEVGAATLAAPLALAAGLAFGGIKYGTNHPALGAGLGAPGDPKIAKEVKGLSKLKGLGKKPIKVPTISPQFANDVRSWATQSDPQLAAALNKYDSQGDPSPWMGDPVAPAPMAGQSPTGSTSTMGLSPTMAKRVSAMQAANPSIKISSGHRTSAQQANLYAAKGGKGVAKPGQSSHQSGHAADVGPPSQFAWIAKNAQKFGLGRPAPKSEPWHLQAMGDPPKSDASNSAGGVTGAQVVTEADTFLGIPYVWGGDSRSGVDCSGLVQSVYAALGISLPRTSEEQATVGTAVANLTAAQPGDLILYNYDGENSHVAIYIGNGQQVAAPETGQVVQVQSVDTGSISTIRRIVGGGAGAAAANAAVNATGSTAPSGAQTTGPGAPGLTNTFISSVGGNTTQGGGSGVSGAGPAAAPAKKASTSAASGQKTTTPASGAASASGGSAAVVAAVKGVTSNKNVQIAMLSGSYLESNQTPDDNGQNVAYGAFMIEISANPVTIAQATDVNFAAQYMVGAYTSGVSKEWGLNNTQQITEQGAIDAAYDAERPAANYFDTQPTRVGPAYALAVQEVGDPVGVGADMGSPPASVSAMSPGGGHSTHSGAIRSSRGATSITIHAPMTVIASAADAQAWGQMAWQAVKDAEAQDSVASG